MSECPRYHSNQTKARIRSSLRRVWGGRMKSRRSKEKFMQSWAEGIANAAKKGGNDQQGLDWDSYDKMKKDIALQQLQEKANAKEITRLRAETKAAKMEIARLRVLRAAETQAAKMAILARKQKEREEKAELKGEVKRKKRVPRKSKEEFAVAPELSLKENLMKIHKKISINGEFTNNGNRAWEKLDLTFIRNGNMPKEVSLADQILAAKQKRAGIISNKAVAGSVE